MDHTHHLEFVKGDIVLDIYGYREEGKVELNEAEVGFGTGHDTMNGNVDEIINNVKKELLGKGFNLTYEIIK